MECAQIRITGGGSASPPTVSFPGAYAGSDPGITIKYDSFLCLKSHSDVGLLVPSTLVSITRLVRTRSLFWFRLKTNIGLVTSYTIPGPRPFTCGGSNSSTAQSSTVTSRSSSSSSSTRASSTSSTSTRASSTSSAATGTQTLYGAFTTVQSVFFADLLQVSVVDKGIAVRPRVLRGLARLRANTTLSACLEPLARLCSPNACYVEFQPLLFLVVCS